MTDSTNIFSNHLPKNWITIKFKYITSIMTCGHAATPDYVDDGIKFLSAQNIKNGFLVLDKYKKIKKELHNKLTKNHRVKKGDLLQARVGGETNIGETCIVNYDFDFSIYVSLTHIRVNKKANNNFIRYLCNSSVFKELSSIEMKKGGGVANLNVSDLEKFRIPLPPMNEQELISQYLDKKTQKIDSLIEKIEQTIVILKEQKIALINQFITKGINPNVEMKDSKIEWVGQIPKHWEIKKLKYVLDKIIDNRGRTPEYSDNGIPMLEIPNITKGIKKPDSNFKKFVKPELVKKYERDKVKIGDVLISTVGATSGQVVIIEDQPKFFICQNIVGLRSNKFINSEFLYYFLKSNYFKYSLDLINKSNTIDNLKVSLFINISCFIPPLNEQIKIITVLDKMILTIEKNIQYNIKKIQLLKEYRQSLISSLVTGKLRITEDIL